jgi:hypothetical protein
MMRSTRSEDLLLECPVCGYTAFASAGLPTSLRQMLEELFELVSRIQPFALIKTLRDSRHSITDRIVTLVARIGATILDYKTFLALIAVFAKLLGRKFLGTLVAAAVMTCMVLHRDIVRKRMEEREKEESA